MLYRNLKYWKLSICTMFHNQVHCCNFLQLRNLKLIFFAFCAYMKGAEISSCIWYILEFLGKYSSKSYVIFILVIELNAGGSIIILNTPYQILSLEISWETNDLWTSSSIHFISDAVKLCNWRNSSVKMNNSNVCYSPIIEIHFSLIIPLGKRWKSKSLPSTTTVWPALLPP